MKLYWRYSILSACIVSTNGCPKDWLYMGKIGFNEKSCGVVSQCVNLRKVSVAMAVAATLTHAASQLYSFYYYVMGRLIFRVIYFELL